MQIVFRCFLLVFFCTITYGYAFEYYLVLASANQQNAASAMGHLFLARGYEAIDYAARVEGSGIIYKVKGFIGGFEATYKVQPFIKKIELYLEKEKREFIFFPLYFSDTEKKRFDDTLNLWLEKKEDYKFATNNCTHGIYRLLQASVDSLPEPYAILLPQDVVTLLQTKNKIGKPESYISPHPYLRTDFGFRFIENSAIFGFQPLLHDKYDRYGFYQADHEFSFLALSIGRNADSLFIDSFSILKITSANPRESFSWFIDSRLDGFETGIGKSFAFYGGKFATDYFLKLRYGKTQRYIAPQFTFRNRSIKNFRYGLQAEFWRQINFWYAYDLSEKNTLIMKSEVA